MQPTRKDWLPELETIHWPRLDELRTEHHRLVEAHRAALGRAPALRAQFANEDECAREAMLTAVREGRDPVHTTMTAGLRRDAEIQVAEERAAETLAALKAHVERTIAALSEHWDEAEEALAKAFEAAGVTEVEENAEPLELGSEEYAARAATERALEIKHGQRRRAISRDAATLQTLATGPLAGAGQRTPAHRGRVKAAA